MARRLDPKGKRTLGVLTKVNLSHIPYKLFID